MSTGADASATTKPTPWLTLLAISSPCVCARSCIVVASAWPSSNVHAHAPAYRDGWSDKGTDSLTIGRMRLTRLAIIVVVALKYGLDEFLTGHERFRAVRPLARVLAFC